MLMMHINEMSLILLLSFLCFRQVTFVQPRLDPIEATVVRQIASTLGANLTNPNDDPCQSRKIYVTQTYVIGTDIENNITCNYYDGNYSHVTNFKLKTMSLQGKLPPELVNLPFLEEIDLTRNDLSGELPKEWATMQHLNTISLTGTGISGEIPKEWGNFPNLTYLSLEANQLSGPIPEELGNLMSLTTLRISDNSFNGTVPEFIGRWTKLKKLEMYSSGLKGPINATIFALENLKDLRITDMIGPEFDFSKRNISKEMKNLVLRNCSMSGSIPAYIWSMDTLETLSGLLPCPRESSCQKYYQSIHINCGGPNVTINHTVYEGDDVAGKGATFPATMNYDSLTKWGFISAGDFMDDHDKNADGYIVKAADTQPNLDLYSTARASPLFLTYYGYCLENGNYTVNLHFAEILFKDKEPYYKVGRRIFDIYIQGILEWQDFNIKEQANQTGKAIIKTFNATVTENTLEIRLYWAGKGTTVIPNRGYYGPLISAISVCRGKSCNSLSAFHSNPVLSDANAAATTRVLMDKNVSELIVMCYALFSPSRFSSVGDAILGTKAEEEICKQAFNLQQKGNLMEIVDPMLEDKFDKEKAEKMIRVALLCSNADPTLRPTMSEVVSMLESQTIVQEVASDPSIYGADLQIKQLKGYYQQMHDQSSSGSSAPNFSSERTGIESSTTSTHDLYPITSESIYSNLICR
ncbi:hypothetical protein EZV62_027020 [Acer yangbiense]|uniref:non-specific serine/threonine protein kinase n=1 Tax=Acer yangbiense TaxID=1000413 RepID=A0A5C7GUD6_9ROSI|nr:hypothetical protein EZV62_027020 [Acer yangbiense]